MTAELRFSFLFLIIVLLLLFQSLKVPIINEGGEIGAGFFPLLISVIILILLFVYIVTLFIKKKDSKETKVTLGAFINQLYLILALIISIIVAKYLGLLITMGIFLIVTFVLIEKLSWKKSIIFSVISMISIYVIFDIWLGLNLPWGIFEN